MSAIFGAAEVKASARLKKGEQTRTVVLRTVPTDTTAEAFADAAKHGIDLSVRVKVDEDRTRSLNGKGVFGEKAVNAVCEVMGFTLPAEKEEKPKPTNRIKDKVPAPSINQTGPTDGAVKS